MCFQLKLATMRLHKVSSRISLKKFSVLLDLFINLRIISLESSVRAARQLKAAEQTSLQLIQRLLAIKVCALEPTSFSSGRLTQQAAFFWLLPPRQIGNPPSRSEFLQCVWPFCFDFRPRAAAYSQIHKPPLPYQFLSTPARDPFRRSRKVFAPALGEWGKRVEERERKKKLKI